MQRNADEEKIGTTYVPYVKLFNKGVEVKMPERLFLTDKSKKILKKGNDGQGFIYFINLDTGEIHLLAATNPEKKVDKTNAATSLEEKRIQNEMDKNEKDRFSKGLKLNELYDKTAKLLDNPESNNTDQLQLLELNKQIQNLENEISGLKAEYQKLKSQLPKKVMLAVDENKPKARAGEEEYKDDEYATTLLPKTSQTGGAGGGDLHKNGAKKLKLGEDQNILAGGFWIKWLVEGKELDFTDFRTRSTQNTRLITFNPIHRLMFDKRLGAGDEVGHTQVYVREIPMVYLGQVIDTFLKASIDFDTTHPLELPEDLYNKKSLSLSPSDKSKCVIPESTQYHLYIESCWEPNRVIQYIIFDSKKSNLTNDEVTALLKGFFDPNFRENLLLIKELVKILFQDLFDSHQDVNENLKSVNKMLRDYLTNVEVLKTLIPPTILFPDTALLNYSIVKRYDAAVDYFFNGNMLSECSAAELANTFRLLASPYNLSYGNYSDHVAKLCKIPGVIEALSIDELTPAIKKLFATLSIDALNPIVEILKTHPSKFLFDTNNVSPLIDQAKRYHALGETSKAIEYYRIASDAEPALLQDYLFMLARDEAAAFIKSNFDPNFRTDLSIDIERALHNYLINIDELKSLLPATIPLPNTTLLDYFIFNSYRDAAVYLLEGDMLSKCSPAELSQSLLLLFEHNYQLNHINHITKLCKMPGVLEALSIDELAPIIKELFTHLSVNELAPIIEILKQHHNDLLLDKNIVSPLIDKAKTFNAHGRVHEALEYYRMASSAEPDLFNRYLDTIHGKEVESIKLEIKNEHDKFLSAHAKLITNPSASPEKLSTSLSVLNKHAENIKNNQYEKYHDPLISQMLQDALKQIHLCQISFIQKANKFPSDSEYKTQYEKIATTIQSELKDANTIIEWSLLEKIKNEIISTDWQIGKKGGESITIDQYNTKIMVPKGVAKMWEAIQTAKQNNLTENDVIQKIQGFADEALKRKAVAFFGFRKEESTAFYNKFIPGNEYNPAVPVDLTRTPVRIHFEHK